MGRAWRQSTESASRPPRGCSRALSIVILRPAYKQPPYLADGVSTAVLYPATRGPRNLPLAPVTASRNLEDVPPSLVSLSEPSFPSPGSQTRLPPDLLASQVQPAPSLGFPGSRLPWFPENQGSHFIPSCILALPFSKLSQAPSTSAVCTCYLCWPKQPFPAWQTPPIQLTHSLWRSLPSSPKLVPHLLPWPCQVELAASLACHSFLVTFCPGRWQPTENFLLPQELAPFPSGEPCNILFPIVQAAGKVCFSLDPPRFQTGHSLPLGRMVLSLSPVAPLPQITAGLWASSLSPSCSNLGHQVAPSKMGKDQRDPPGAGRSSQSPLCQPLPGSFRFLPSSLDLQESFSYLPRP